MAILLHKILYTLLQKDTKTSINYLRNMISLKNLPDISVAEAAEIEQIQVLIVNAIDSLEQVARARELTNIIWDVNASSQTEQEWMKTEVLLESYEQQRDEALESALSDLRELNEMMKVSVDVSNLPNISPNNVGFNIGMSASA